MKRFYLFSLGCKVNSYENNAIGTMLIQKGYQKVNSPEEADAIILNTCSVTSRADQKSRQHISKMRKLNPTPSFWSWAAIPNSILGWRKSSARISF